MADKRMDQNGRPISSKGNTLPAAILRAPIRDAARLNLRHAERMPFDPQFRKNESDALSATIIVDRPEQLFAELSGRGAEFHQLLKSEEWGSRTFIIRDPDGNLVCFAGR